MGSLKNAMKLIIQVTVVLVFLTGAVSKADELNQRHNLWSSPELLVRSRLQISQSPLVEERDIDFRGRARAFVDLAPQQLLSFSIFDEMRWGPVKGGLSSGWRSENHLGSGLHLHGEHSDWFLFWVQSSRFEDHTYVRYQGPQVKWQFDF